MNKSVLKGILGVIILSCTTPAIAQLPQLKQQPLELSTKENIKLSERSIKALQTANPQQVLGNRNVKLSTPYVKGTPNAALTTLPKVVKRDGETSPATFYNADSGYYNLVPGFGLYAVSDDSIVYSRRGILGYPDRDLHFYNQTPEFDNLIWDFSGVQYEADTMSLHPYFGSGTTYYMDTPYLTATLNNVDSTYCMGYGFDYLDSDNNVGGMVALTGGAYAYNVDVDADPFYNTFYNALGADDVWEEGNILFGWDTSYESAFIELFDAPYDGAIGLWATQFYILTPTTVDLAKKKDYITVTWAAQNTETGEWEALKTFDSSDLTIYRDPTLSGSSLRVWFVSVMSDQPILTEGSFYVMITGPQDGTEWALCAQLDRLDFPDPERNTAYFVPSVGEYAGLICQYVLTVYDEEGTEYYDYTYCSSLDIHQYFVTPYMLLYEQSTETLLTETYIDFNIDGETQSYYIGDWDGGVSDGVSMTATITNSTDEDDWITVDEELGQSELYSDYFDLNITVSSKPWNVEGRRATLTLKDNLGFKREFVIYQGDHDVADEAAAVATVNASGKVNVTAQGNTFSLTYPTDFSNLNIYSTSGQRVGTYALSSGGSQNINVSSLRTGMYILQFVGKDTTQTVKVVKK